MPATKIRDEQAIQSVSLTTEVTGQLPVANGGTGATTLTGLVKASGTSAFTAVTAPSGVIVGDTDTQTLTSKTLTLPKIDAVRDTNGVRIFEYQTTASAVNWVGTLNHVAGQPPALYATGSDTNIDLNLVTKGTGVVKANGAEVATISGTQTLTNKTLTSPKINTIYDTNGDVILAMSPAGSAVNYLMIYNGAGTNYAGFAATGTATDVGFGIQPKGNGPLQIYEGAGQTSAVITANGTATNVNLNLKTQGTGVIQANGVEVATISGAQTLSNKTLADPVVNDSIFAVNGTRVQHFIGVASGVNYVRASNAAAGGSPYITSAGADTNSNLLLYGQGTGKVFANDIEVATISGTQTLTNKTLTSPRVDVIRDTNGNVLLSPVIQASAVNYLEIANGATANSPMLRAAGSDTNLDFWLRSKGTGVVALVDSTNAAIARFGKGSGTTVNYFDIVNSSAGNTPQIGVWGTDADVGMYLRSKGVGSISLRDGNDKNILVANSNSGAVNYIGVRNAAAGSPPQIELAGTDTDIALKINSKGTGAWVGLCNGNGQLSLMSAAPASAVNYVRVDGAVTGGAPTISANGTDTDVDLTLAVKGNFGRVRGPIAPRVTTVNAPGATPTYNLNNYEQVNFTGLAVAITSMTSGLTYAGAADGEKRMLRFKDNGTARAIAWGANFVSSGVATLLATTVAGKTHMVGLIYDSAAAKWVCMACDAVGY